MNRSTRTRILFVLAAFLVAGAVLESPRAVLGEEPPAATSFEVDRAMTLTEFLGEVEKRVPGLFTWRAKSRHLGRTTVPLGPYSLDRVKLVRHLRALLIRSEIVLIYTGEPGKERYAVTDMRAIAGPDDPKLQPVEVDLATRVGLMHDHGLYVKAKIPAAGLTHLDAVQRTLRVVLTRENVGRIRLLEDGSAFEVIDFAPRVDLAHRLAKELAALQALGK